MIFIGASVGEKQKCNDCDLKTSVRKYLKGHIVKHTGQYQCQQCKLAFKSLAELDVHISSKHGKTKPEKPFMCDKCEESFSTIHMLRLHSQRKHVPSQATTECQNCGQTFSNPIKMNGTVSHQI